MKNLTYLFIILMLSFLGCDQLGLLGIGFDLPYETTYTVHANKQIGDSLILTSKEFAIGDIRDSIDSEIQARDLANLANAEVSSLMLTLPEDSEIDWSIVDTAWVKLYLDGVESPLSNEIQFPTMTGKSITIGISEGVFTYKNFLSYTTAKLSICARLSENLDKDVDIKINAIVSVEAEPL